MWDNKEALSYVMSHTLRGCENKEALCGSLATVDRYIDCPKNRYDCVLKIETNRDAP